MEPNENLPPLFPHLYEAGKFGKENKDNKKVRCCVNSKAKRIQKALTMTCG